MEGTQVEPSRVKKAFSIGRPYLSRLGIRCPTAMALTRSISVLLLAGTAAMAQDSKDARPVRTPWPAEMPCAAPAYLRVSYASAGSVWASRSGATLALAEGG